MTFSPDLFPQDWDDEDVAALVQSIDNSQVSRSLESLYHLPSLPEELLLHILEYVPVDYILDWRLICRGFKTAIDSKVLYYHLQRTQLTGCIAPRDVEYLYLSSQDERYQRIRFAPAHFHHVGSPDAPRPSQQNVPTPNWNHKLAFFHISPEWLAAFRGLSTAFSENADDAYEWRLIARRLRLCVPEENYGTLRWCVTLDHAVLDMDFPIDMRDQRFHVAVDLERGVVTVEWRPMLVSLLKTERAMRRNMAKQQNSPITFSLEEDTLRYTRRQRLFSALDPSSQHDRHLLWSLRLLVPLFGIPKHYHNAPLESIEDDAVRILLTLRRQASLSSRYKAYLHSLRAGYDEMMKEKEAFEGVLEDFKQNVHMAFRSHRTRSRGIGDPLEWSEELITRVEHQMERWRREKKVVDQVMGQLQSANMAIDLEREGGLETDSEFGS